MIEAVSMSEKVVFKIGDVVKLVSGGPEMAVVEVLDIKDYGTNIAVRWYCPIAGTFLKDFFVSETLELFDETQIKPCCCRLLPDCK